MLTKIFHITVLSALTLGLFGSGTAMGAPLLAEDFESLVDGKTHSMARQTSKGRGWQAKAGGDARGGARDVLTFPAAGNIRADQGTVELDVVRSNSHDVETLFMIGDEKEGKIRVDIHWEGKEPFTRKTPVLAIESANSVPILWFREYEFPLGGGKIKTIKKPWIPLKGIAVGERFHLSFTWNSNWSDCKIYLNGTKLEASFTDGQSIVEAIEASSLIAVGGHPARNGEIVWDQARSVIKSVHIYDELIDGADLYAHPERYRPVTGSMTVASLDHDAARTAGFSGKLVAGDVMTVFMDGTPGQAASFDVARLADRRGEIPVSWAGWGVYLEEITFFEDDQVDLRDVEEYRVYVSADPIGEITLDTPFVEDLEVEQQGYTVDTVSVADEDGESYDLETLEIDTPYYIAVMALMDDNRLLPVIESVQGIAMRELEDAPGTYEGAYTVDYGDRYPEAVVVGRIGSGDAQAVLVSDETIEVDPALNIQVSSSVEELKADEESTAVIKVIVTDANDDPVSGHELRFVLATTSQYTGVVGGGSFTDEVGGSLSRDFWGETDLFGQVTATYTAGFAAKTAIIVARDMQSNDVGSGYVKTYIEATAELELEAVQEVAGKALGYTITVTSSDEWLTADGESEARITALVAKNGIPVEGHRVSFRVTAGTGKIRTIVGETGSDGKARAVYTAGKKVGVVLITAVDQTVGISGSVQIELRSDAPAKIAITLTPDLLPADGRSTADIEVVVTDINDNPNEGVEVEYEVEIGSGRLRRIDEVTDRKGESTAEYVAGRMPGKVSIKVTVRSTVPTEEEMAEARALATAVTDYDFF